MSYQGQCLCGTVHYRLSNGIHNIVHCHCSRCRRAQGSAFATNGIVSTEHFRLTQGENNLTTYEHVPGQQRWFCKTCGSPIYSQLDSQPDHVRIRVGTIISDIGERPMAHIFTASKANWEDICGELPQYEEYEPDR